MIANILERERQVMRRVRKVLRMWPAYRRRLERQDRERQAHANNEEAVSLVAAGWMDWSFQAPPGHLFVEARRPGRWHKVIRGDDCSPFMNVGGLYWRPVQHEIDGCTTMAQHLLDGASTVPDHTEPGNT